MDDTINRQEFEQFAKRLEDEDNRQNRRIQILEDNMKSLSNLTISVEKMAVNMEAMVKEQAKQGERLSKLEMEPAERWNTMKRTIFTSIVSTIGGALAAGLIMMLAQAL